MRLIDHLRGRTPVAPFGASFVPPGAWEQYEHALREDLAGIPVIVADNIDDFVFSSWEKDFVATERYALKPSDIPNLVPPFPKFFVEWKPADQYSRARVEFLGALIEAVDYGHHPDKPRPFDDARFGFGVRFFLKAKGANFVLHGVSMTVFCSDYNGDFLDAEDDFVFVRGAMRDQTHPMGASAKAPPMVAISFMNCRNVKLIDIDPPSKLSKATKRRTGHWLERYKVIEIVPMSRLIRAAQEAEADPDKRRKIPFHIVRGHLKRYTEDGKLFGRHTGTYFWGQTARGSTANGEVRKDFVINTHGKKR